MHWASCADGCSQKGGEMDDPLAPILTHAKKDRFGNIVIAHLRREREDTWDALVVAENGLLPLVFWAPSALHAEDAIRDDEGNVLHVIQSTPPGVTPSGLVPSPADANSSPTGTLISIVTSEGHTSIRPPHEEPLPPPDFGPTMLRSLFENVAHRKGTEYAIADLETAAGGTIPVLLDWDGRPILFWVDMPKEQSERTLMTAVATDKGFVAMAVDDELRPLHSKEWLTEHLA
jgi:hypothetical protein